MGFISAVFYTTIQHKFALSLDFPLGHYTDIKLAETEQALADGANEIDMVMAIGSALQED